MDAPAPLHGLVVTELGRREAAGICGSLLSQLGATVVVVEPVDAAGGVRMRDRHRRHLVAGKLSFAPDGANAADRRLLDRLVRRSDVVIISSDADPSGIRPEDLPAECVLCDISAFGGDAAPGGPALGSTLGDVHLQALSGIMDTTGQADGPPVPIGVPIVSYLTGTYAAGAVLAALRVRRLQGTGQRIEVALFDAAFVTLNSFLSSILTDGSAQKSRMGNRHPTVAPWNLYRTADGWVLICAGNEGQWERLCALIGKPDLAPAFPNQASRIAGIQTIDDAIEGWTRGRSTEDCIEGLTASGVASGPIAPIDLHPREANLDYREMIRRVRDPEAERDVFISASPIALRGTPARAPDAIPARGQSRAEVERIADALRSPPAAAPARGLERPLSGVRVIEIGQYTTAPLCARHLAHLGAEVIKIEQPGGDASRTWVPHVGGRSVSFRLNNSDKRSLVLDLRSREGRDVLAALLASADVLVENSKPGTLSKFGFSNDEITAINGRLVHCAISGFGADSLYASRPAFDSVIQAMSGFMTALCPDEIPLKSGISTADTMGAEMAIVAIVAALESRDRTGHGQFIDLSMQDISCWITETAWNRDPRGAARPAVVRCGDGYVVAEATAAALDQALAARGRTGVGAFAAMTRLDAVAAIEGAGIAAAAVNSVREASALPYTLKRKLWFMMEEAGLEWPMLASPMRLGLTPAKVTHLAPDTNADAEAILSELGVAAPAEGVRA